MTAFLEEFNRDTGFNSMCATGYPNSIWGGVWASATSNAITADQFYWGVENTAQTAAFVQWDAENVGCGTGPGGAPRTDMYYGDDDDTVFPITPWSEAVHPRFQTRFKITDNGSVGTFANGGFVAQDWFLGEGFQGRSTQVSVQHQTGASSMSIHGENDGGSVGLPDPTLDAWYTLEALWTDAGLEFRLWLDESESRPADPTLAVGPATPAPAVTYDDSFGPDIEWKCQVLPNAVLTGDERGKVALDFIRIIDFDADGGGGGGGGGGSIGDGGGDSHPGDGNDGSGSDQNPNGFLSSMTFYEAFAG